MRSFQALRQRSRRDVRRRPRLELLEDRVVLSVAFDSVLPIGGASQDTALKVATDTNGDAYVTGWFTGTVDFDRDHSLAYDTLTSQALPDGTQDNIYVAKYAGATGELLWVRSFMAYAGYVGAGITTSGAAAVYLAGNFSGTADFDPTNSYPDGRDLRTASGDSDSFVLRLDATNGSFAWAWNSGDPTGEMGNDLALDGVGNVYTAGVSKVNSTPGQTVFVTKLDAAGTQAWTVAAQPSLKYTSKPFGNAKAASGGIAVRGGSVIVTGEFQGQVDFDPGAGTANLTSTGNAFVWKLTTSGMFTWVRAFGGWGEDVAADANGNIYSTGFFGGTVDFDPGRGTYNLTSTQTEGTYVSKLDASGNFVWAIRTAGGSNGNQQIALDPTESRVILVGGFGGTADFDPGPGTYYLTPADGTGTGKGDLFATSLTASAGAFDWAVRMGGPGRENLALGDGLAIDTAGHVFVAGSFELSADFGPYSLTSAGSDDGFLARLSPTTSASNSSRVATRSPAAPTDWTSPKGPGISPRPSRPGERADRYVDGLVRWTKQSIAMPAYRALSTIQGGEIVSGESSSLDGSSLHSNL